MNYAAFGLYRFWIWRPYRGAFNVRSVSRLMAHNTDGATAIEYGLIIGLAALGIAGGISAVSDLVQLMFAMLGDSVGDISAGIGETAGDGAAGDDNGTDNQQPG